MKFIAIRWKNLLSTGNDWIQLKLDDRPMTLIIGKNGHGKSQLLDAICFGLFNQAFRNINKNQLVNTINKKQLIVEIVLESHNSKYVIRRGIKPNIFEIIKDGSILEQGADHQLMLEKDILSIDYKTFCQVNVLGSASYTPFMLLKSDQRRKVVEELLDGQIYGKMLLIAKAKHKQMQSEFQQLSADIDINKHKIQTQQTLISKQLELKENYISQQKSEINKLVVTETVLSKQLDSKIIDLTTQSNKLISFDVNIEAAGLMVIDYNNQLQVLKYQKSQLKLNEVTDICSECGQLVDQDHLKAQHKLYHQHISTILNQIDQLNTRVVKLNEVISTSNTLTKSMTDTKNNINNLQQQIQNISVQIDNITKNIKTSPYTTIDVTHEQLDLNKFNQQLHKSTNDYNKVSKDLEINKQCINLLADDGLKAQLIDKYIPIINQSINNFLEKMDLFVSFELNSQFEETIKSRYRDTFSYGSFSEGEKLRIDLAILFTWRYIAKLKNSASSNLLIMDEVLDSSLDDSGVDDFIEIIKNTVDNENTIVISHKQSIVDNFDYVITAEKDGLFTSYTSNV